MITTSHTSADEAFIILTFNTFQEEMHLFNYIILFSISMHETVSSVNCKQKDVVDDRHRSNVPMSAQVDLMTY